MVPVNLKFWVVKLKVKIGRDPSVLIVNHCYTALFIWDLVTHAGRAAEPLINHSPPSLPDKQFVNLVLAFVNTFHLRNDNTSLKSAIATQFDTAWCAFFSQALWDFSGPDLSRLGLTYQFRGNADKQQLFESIFCRSC